MNCEFSTVKKQYLCKIFTVFPAILLLIILAACSDKQSASTAVADEAITLTETAFATAIDMHNRPLNKNSYFPPETPKIYCCVKISNAPADTELRADWVYVKGEDITAENTVMDSTSVKVDGTRYVAFSFAYSDPNTKWIKGEYLVILYVNDVPRIQGPFIIK